MGDRVPPCLSRRPRRESRQLRGADQGRGAVPSRGALPSPRQTLSFVPQEAPGTEASASPITPLPQGWVPVKETEKVSTARLHVCVCVCARIQVDVPHYLFLYAENQVSGLTVVANRTVPWGGGRAAVASNCSRPRAGGSGQGLWPPGLHGLAPRPLGPQTAVAMAANRGRATPCFPLSIPLPSLAWAARPGAEASRVDGGCR